MEPCRPRTRDREDAFYAAATKIIAAALERDVERARTHATPTVPAAAPYVSTFVKEWLEENKKAVRNAPDDKRAAVREQHNEAAARSLEARGQKTEAGLARQAVQTPLYAPRSDTNGAQRAPDGPCAKLQLVIETEARGLGVTEDMRSAEGTARDAVKSAVGRVASAVGLDREAVEGRIATDSPNALVERNVACP